MPERQGAFSPLEHRTFRWLWIAFSISSIGLWMQALGAQWFLVSRPDGGALVALVQAALTLPMALLAIPAGVLADNLDRRRMLLIVQVGALLASLVLTALMVMGTLSPPVLLLLTAVLGSGAALSLTPFQSLIPVLVSRPRIPAAAAIVGVGANLARIVGPALAGILVARLGIAAVFALNAVTIVVFLIVLLRWNGTTERVSRREHFLPAVRSGVRYVRHSPQVLKLMLRSFWFTAPMMAIFALLPLVATERLGMGSEGYGLLFGFLGAGAVAGAVSVSRLRARFTTNVIVAAAVIAAALVTALIPFVTVPIVAIGMMLAAGVCWTVTNSTMAGALQIYLPAWVRARGLSFYSMALFGGQAIGSLIVGWVASHYGLTVAFVGSAVVMALGFSLALLLPLKELEGIDRTPIDHWSEPALVVDPDEVGGEVVVSITYWVDDINEVEFLSRMEQVRRVRLRTGGTEWRLLKDGELARRYVEEYTVSSWSEYQAQDRARHVASDQVFEDRVAELSSPAPEVHRLFRRDVRETGWR